MRTVSRGGRTDWVGTSGPTRITSVVAWPRASPMSSTPSPPVRSARAHPLTDPHRQPTPPFDHACSVPSVRGVGADALRTLVSPRRPALGSLNSTTGEGQTGCGRGVVSVGRDRL